LASAEVRPLKGREKDGGRSPVGKKKRKKNVTVTRNRESRTGEEKKKRKKKRGTRLRIKASQKGGISWLTAEKRKGDLKRSC